jgi:hypothetical protein
MSIAKSEIFDVELSDIVPYEHLSKADAPRPIVFETPELTMIQVQLLLLELLIKLYVTVMGHSDEQYYRFAMLCDTVNHIIIASI